MRKVRETFRRFENDLRTILDDSLFEIIIHGSYVLGDFRPNFGDLDFMVLCEKSLDEGTIESLSSLHTGYRSDKPLLLHQLEGSYCPKSIMRNPEEPFVGFYVGTTRMKPINSRQNSYMDFSLIQQQGLFLLGSNCEVYEPGGEELLNQQFSDCAAFRRTLSEIGSIDAGFCISLIHWGARTLFHRAKGRIASKTEACRWCSEQKDLKEFRDLFIFAEPLRSPFGEATMNSRTGESCTGLLDLMDVRLHATG